MQGASRLGGVLLLCLVVIAAAPFLGAELISPVEIFKGSTSLNDKIFWELRLPRVLLGACVGAALAVGGVVFQASFRNPLASPFTLGVASGAAFGASMSIWLGGEQLFGSGAAVIFALAGAAITVLLVFGLARLRGGLTDTTMLLCGVIISFFFSSAVVFLQYVSDYAGVFRITRWLMGKVEVVGFQETTVVAVVTLPCVSGIWLLARRFDLLSLGDELAAARGLNVARAQGVSLLVVSLMVGTVVAFCGPIAFVGVIVPHVCRSLVGHLHAQLIPASLLSGAAFLVLGDALARSIVAPYEIPVGVCTAVLGAPVFLHLLLRANFR